jgi:hypothetical protein
MHVLLIRNNREDQQGLGEGQEVKEEELVRPHQGGVQVQLDFDSTSDSRTSDSIYGWKQNFIELPMAPVPPQNAI